MLSNFQCTRKCVEKRCSRGLFWSVISLFIEELRKRKKSLGHCILMLDRNSSPNSHPVSTLRFSSRSSKSSFPLIVYYQSLASFCPSIKHACPAHLPALQNRRLHTKAPFLLVTQNLNFFFTYFLLVQNIFKIICLESRFVFALRGRICMTVKPNYWYNDWTACLDLVLKRQVLSIF
jgi:hypothetical protein